MEPNEQAIDIFIASVRKLIENDHLKDSLDLLNDPNSPIPASYRNSITINLTSYNRLNNEYNSGLVTNEDFRVENARIANRLLNILDRIPEEIKLKQLIPIYSSTNHKSLEKILGDNDMVKIKWLKIAILKSKSVCQIRLINGDKAIGTGFLVNNGYIMTNYHVIPNTTAASRVKIVFDYEEDITGQVRKTSEYLLDRNTALFSPINELDCCLVKVIDDSMNSLSLWGHLDINTTPPSINDPVSIIQHPLGQTKQIALTANRVIGINGNKLFYETDTERGSSGSPVFNQNWEVVALHHAGKTQEDGGLVIDAQTGEKRGANEGILMKDIYDKFNNVFNP